MQAYPTFIKTWDWRREIITTFYRLKARVDFRLSIVTSQLIEEGTRNNINDLVTLIVCVNRLLKRGT